MEDETKIILSVIKNAATVVKSSKWKQSVNRTDKGVDSFIKKLSVDSEVDPKLLDEPATV